MPVMISWFVCFFLAVFSASAVFGKDTSKSPIHIQADQLRYNRNTNEYTAIGNVIIKSREMILKADKVVLNNTTKDAQATGHVTLTDHKDILTCTHLKLNLITRLGTIYKGILKTKKGNYTITGERVDRLGPERFRVYQGTFTTCSSKKPAWQFKADQMDVTVEGYAVARGAKFYAAGIPLLYSPYVIYPTKRKRQSGFLIPSAGGSSRSGGMVSESFFWAISEDKDATFTETYYGNRGFKHGLEFRYARTTKSQGQLNLYYIHDRDYDDDSNRWAVIFRHDELFNNGFYAKADINKISDNDYLIDFSNDIPGKSSTDARRENILKSKVTFGKNWSKYTFNGEFSYYDDLTQRNNDYTTQRYPYLTLNALEQPLFRTPLNYTFNSTYAFYYKKEAEKNQYMDLYPTLSYPLELFNVIQIKPQAGFRETMLWPSDVADGQEDDFESRGIPDLDINFYTVFQKIYKTKSGNAYKHTIKPEVTYQYIPDIDQDDLYWLGRINKKSLLSYGLTSFLIGKTVTEDGNSTYHDYVRFKIYQDYDFEADDHEFSNISAQLDLWPSKYISSSTRVIYDHAEGDLPQFLETVKASDKRGDSLWFDYRYRKSDTQQLNLHTFLKLTETINLIYNTMYDFREDDFIESTYGLVYHPECWRLDLLVHQINESEDGTIPSETQVRVMLTLEGIGGFGN